MPLALQNPATPDERAAMDAQNAELRNRSRLVLAAGQWTVVWRVSPYDLSIGSFTVEVLPCPGRLATSIVAPC